MERHALYSFAYSRYNMNVLLRGCKTVKTRILSKRSGFAQTRSFGFFGKKPDNADKIELKKFIDGDAAVALERRRRRETIESRFPPLTSGPKSIEERFSSQPLAPPKYVIFIAIIFQLTEATKD